MKKFVAQLNGGEYICIDADEMDMKDDVTIRVYSEGKLVALVDTTCVVCAHLSEKGAKTCKN